MVVRRHCLGPIRKRTCYQKSRTKRYTCWTFLHGENRCAVDATRSIGRMIPVELVILDGPKKRDEAGSVVCSFNVGRRPVLVARIPAEHVHYPPPARHRRS